LLNGICIDCDRNSVKYTIINSTVEELCNNVQNRFQDIIPIECPIGVFKYDSETKYMNNGDLINSYNVHHITWYESSNSQKRKLSREDLKDEESDSESDSEDDSDSESDSEEEKPENKGIDTDEEDESEDEESDTDEEDESEDD
jgi:hypothetical protein